MLPKILHIGFPNIPFSKALIGISSEYQYIDWTAWTAIPNNITNLENHILFEIDLLNADLIFLQIQTDNVISAEFAKKMSEKCKVINWTWDYREPTPQWIVDCAPYVTSAFTNEADVKFLSELGHKAIFLQGGFDTEVYKPEGSIIKSPEIVFMANNYPTDDYTFPLANYRIEMVNLLKEKYKDQFAVFGFGWPNPNPLQSFMHRELKEAECYRSCKVAINLSHYEAERYTSDRIFRLLGSGAMCLTHKYPGIQKDFIDGIHLRTWSNFDELIKLIDYYILNEGQRKNIAEAGCNLVHQNYTWSNMTNQILNLL